MSSGRLNVRKLVMVVFWIILFYFVFVFFNNAHPILIFDTDDWQYIGYSRHAIPWWNAWNPTRVFPEVAMSAVSMVGSQIIYPITGRFIESLAFVFAFVVSLCVIIYVFYFYLLMLKRFRTDEVACLFLSVLFLIFHFVVFREVDNGNSHMFYSLDACVYFYYTIPNLLNCIIVMRLLIDDFLYNPFEKLRTGYYLRERYRLGIWIVILYFALFSNLYASIIVAVFIGTQLLPETVSLLKKQKSNLNYIKENILRLSYLAIWCGVQIFEMFGGRARSLKSEKSFIILLKETISFLVNIRHNFNKMFLCCIVLILSYTVLMAAYRSKRNITDNIKKLVGLAFQMLIMSGLILIYLIVVCSVHGAYHIARPDVLFGAVFPIFIIIMMCICYSLIENQLLISVIPLMAVVLLVECNTPGVTYKNPNVRNLSTQLVLDIDNDIINQLKLADQSGADECILYVPIFNSGSNWPISAYSGKIISDSLYKHGVLSRSVAIKEIIPDENKNEYFHLK